MRKRLFTSTLLGILALLVFAFPASAGRTWCAADPTVVIDGTPVQIWVAVPAQYQPYVKDAIEVRIGTPSNLSHKVTYLDSGFNGRGERVDWQGLNDPNPGDGVYPIGVEVRVQFDISRMEKAFGKDAVVADIGKDEQVPVQVVVNIGNTTSTFETAVYYGTHKSTKFNMTVTASSASAT